MGFSIYKKYAEFVNQYTSYANYGIKNEYAEYALPTLLMEQERLQI
jgi:hypothetical protein